mgnify:CR=1 FL=1
MFTLDQGGAGRALLEVHESAGAARRFAEFSWIQPTTPEPNGRSWRIVPDASPHLIHHRLHDGHTRTLVVGARSVFVDVAQRERKFTVGIHLRPGVLTLLLEEGASAAGAARSDPLERPGIIGTVGSSDRRSSLRRSDTNMVDQDLLDILVCPESKQPVRSADAELLDALDVAIRDGSVVNAGGQPVEDAVVEGPVQEGGHRLHSAGIQAYCAERTREMLLAAGEFG